MAYIDPDGYFDGDRFDLITDEARVFWPTYWCASNGHGRIELNYRKVVGTAFNRWKNPPNEDQFWAHIREYRDGWLLFVYEHDGVLWGQWDSSDKFLPRYKSASDNKTPAPDPEALTAWKTTYISSKRAKSNVFNNCEKVSVSQKVFHAAQYDIDNGVDLAVDFGVGKNLALFAPAHASAVVVAMPPPKAINPLTAQKAIWFKEFWSLYWLKRSKFDAENAFKKAVKCEADWLAIKAAMIRQSPEMLERDPRKRPYPASWIRAGAMFDEAAPEPQARGQTERKSNSQAMVDRIAQKLEQRRLDEQRQ